jgi:hypothetical protein
MFKVQSVGAAVCNRRKFAVKNRVTLAFTHSLIFSFFLPSLAEPVPIIGRLGEASYSFEYFANSSAIPASVWLPVCTITR